MDRFTDADKLRLHLELDMLIAKIETVKDRCKSPAALRTIGNADGDGIRWGLMLCTNQEAIDRLMAAFPANPILENF